MTPEQLRDLASMFIVKGQILSSGELSEHYRAHAAALEELAACREVIARIVNAADATLCDPEGTVCIQGSDGDRAILQAAIDAARRMK